MNTGTENRRVYDGTSWGWLCYLWIAIITAALSIHIDLLNWRLLRLEILMKHFSGGSYFLWWNQKSHTFFCRKEQRGEKTRKEVGKQINGVWTHDCLLRALLKTQSEDTRTDVHCAALPGQQIMYFSPRIEKRAAYNVFLIWIIIIIYEILAATDCSSWFCFRS